ncbi:MAG: encapsulin [Archaeoglobaceae archaeon]
MTMLTSAILPVELTQAISEVVVVQARATRVGRNLVTVEKVDAGATTYKFRKFIGFTKVDEIPEGAEFPLEGVSYSEEVATIKKIGKAFLVTREEVLANKLHSIAQLARDAAEVVALKEDELIVAELVSDAGKTQAAGAAWNSSTANPYNDVSNALAKLEEVAVKPNVLVVNPLRMADLRKIDANSMRTFQELIEGLGLKIITTPSISASTGLLLDTSKAGVLAVAEDITIEDPVYKAENQSYLVNVYERVVPVCRYPNAICKLTGLST